MSTAAAATLHKQFLTREEVKNLLKLRTPRTLDKWERQHKGPPRLNIGGKLVLYDYDRLLAWIQGHETTPRPPRKRGRPRKGGAR
jgi:hypothetical protein